MGKHSRHIEDVLVITFHEELFPRVFLDSLGTAFQLTNLIVCPLILCLVVLNLCPQLTYAFRTATKVKETVLVEDAHDKDNERSDNEILVPGYKIP